MKPNREKRKMMRSVANGTIAAADNPLATCLAGQVLELLDGYEELEAEHDDVLRGIRAQEKSAEIVNKAKENEVVAMEGSKVAEAIARVVQGCGPTWTGTMSNLYEDMCKVMDDDEKQGRDWPQSALGLRKGYMSVRRIAPMLYATHRINVEFHPPANGKRTIMLTKIDGGA